MKKTYFGGSSRSCKWKMEESKTDLPGRTYEKHQMRLNEISRQNEVKQKKGIVESDYLKMKKQLSKYKGRAGDFKREGR